MAIGDDALAAGMAILTGNERANTLHTEENKTRDYIAQRTSLVTPVAKGGTGADNAAAALANLGALPRSEVYDGTGSVLGKVARWDAFGRLICASPAQDNHAVPLGVVNALFSNYLPRWGGNLDQGTLIVSGAGQIAIQNATPVTSGYAALYRNSDGRVGISPSARKFKKDIRDHAYTREQLRGVRVITFRLKAGYYGEGWQDAPTEVGVLAEDLIDAGLSEFVVFDEKGEPLTVHYERLALIALSVLQDALDRLDDIEARLAALEA